MKTYTYWVWPFIEKSHCAVIVMMVMHVQVFTYAGWHHWRESLMERAIFSGICLALQAKVRKGKFQIQARKKIHG